MNLRNTTIYIVGLGGTGGRLSELLCDYITFYNTKPARIVLVDDDVIEMHNAERQCFDRLDAGKFKVEIIRNRLLAKSNFSYIEALPIRFTPETMPHDIGKMSENKASIIVFICIDSARGRNAIWSELVGPYNAETRQYEVAEPKYKGTFVVFDGGNTDTTGQVVTAFKTKVEQFDILLGQDPRELFANIRNADPTVTSCAAAPEDRVPQTVTANMQVATIMFNEFRRLVKEHEFYPLVKFDLDTCQMTPIGQKINLEQAYALHIQQQQQLIKEDKSNV